MDRRRLELAADCVRLAARNLAAAARCLTNSSDEESEFVPVSSDEEASPRKRQRTQEVPTCAVFGTLPASIIQLNGNVVKLQQTVDRLQEMAATGEDNRERTSILNFKVDREGNDFEVEWEGEADDEGNGSEFESDDDEGNGSEVEKEGYDESNISKVEKQGKDESNISEVEKQQGDESNISEVEKQDKDESNMLVEEKQGDESNIAEVEEKQGESESNISEVVEEKQGKDERNISDVVEENQGEYERIISAVCGIEYGQRRKQYL